MSPFHFVIFVMQNGVRVCYLYKCMCYNFAMKKQFLPLLFITAMSLTACGGKSYAPSEYIAGSLEYQPGFKILQLTDIHLSDKDDQALQLKFVDHLIEDAKANNDIKLMVVTGDLFTFASRSTAKKLFKHLEAIK